MAGVTAFGNESAERALLALLTIDSKKYSSSITELMPEDFSLPEHRHIFTAMQNLYLAKRDIDLVTLSERMHELYGEEEAQLTQILIDSISEHHAGSTWAIQQHVEIIKAASLRRRTMEILDKARDELSDDTNETSAVLDRTRQALRDIVITGHSWQSIEEVLISTLNTLERHARGEEPSMPSGIPSLDKFICGFHRGEVTIIGARPAVGKSALGAHIAMKVAEKGYKVGICSREMTDIQYGTRIITRGTDIPNSKLRTGDLGNDDWDAIAETMMLYANLNVSFMFSTRYIEDLRLEVQKKVDANELDMLVIDYVQLLQTRQRFEKDYLRIAYISKMLKDMSVDMNISIISLAQVGRGSEGTMPTLSELRGSGDLEQDADNVIFMHRPADVNDKYVRPNDRELFNTLQQTARQYIALNIAKQRQGGIGTVPVIFDPAHMTFSAIAQNDNPAPKPRYA